MLQRHSNVPATFDAIWRHTRGTASYQRIKSYTSRSKDVSLALFQTIHRSHPSLLSCMAFTKIYLIASSSNCSVQPQPRKSRAMGVLVSILCHREHTIWHGGRTEAMGLKHFEFALQTDGSSSYVAKVGPLCPYDFGDINRNIP